MSPSDRATASFFSPLTNHISLLTWEVQSSLQITGNNEVHFLHYCFRVSPSDMLIQCVRRFDELHGHIGNLPEPIGGQSRSQHGQRTLHVSGENRSSFRTNTRTREQPGCFD